jgi:hypothetical protein
LQAATIAANGLPAVNVARPGLWGNPFIIGMSRCTGQGVGFTEQKIEDAATAVRYFREMLTVKQRNFPSAEEIKGLRGKNLACWCKPGEPCHADVLLELANA